MRFTLITALCFTSVSFANEPDPLAEHAAVIFADEQTLSAAIARGDRKEIKVARARAFASNRALNEAITIRLKDEDAQFRDLLERIERNDAVVTAGAECLVRLGTAIEDIEVARIVARLPPEARAAPTPRERIDAVLKTYPAQLVTVGEVHPIDSALSASRLSARVREIHDLITRNRDRLIEERDRRVADARASLR